MYADDFMGFRVKLMPLRSSALYNEDANAWSALSRQTAPTK